MNDTHNHIYNELRFVLKRNIDSQERYAKTSTIAKEEDVKSFFKNKSYSRSLFNEKLKYELNYAFHALTPDGSYSNDKNLDHTASNDVILDPSDEFLLLESIKEDKQALYELDALLKYDNLPLSIRFLIKELITIIRLDELKLEQLIHICK